MFSPFVVRVDVRTPRTLWSPRQPQSVEPDTRSPEVCIKSRAPVVRALCLKYELSARVLMRRAAMELCERSLEAIMSEDLNESVVEVVGLS